MAALPPISALLPHTGPMCLLDTLLSYSNEHIEVALTVRDQPPFGNGLGSVPAYVGIEYMAQAIAAFAGLETYQQGQPPQIGLLIGSRKVSSRVAEFADGSPLRVLAQLVLRDDGNLCVFRCQIYNDSQVELGNAEVKAYRPNNIADFLNA